MKRKPKLWNITLDHGDFTTDETVRAIEVARVPNTNRIVADTVEITFGGNIVHIEEAK